jgi:adenylate kinase
MVSKILSKKLDIEHIEISKFAKEKEFIIGEDSRRNTGIIDMFRLFRSIDEIVSVHNKPLLLDGHYAHDYVHPTEDIIVFVLRRAPWILYGDLKSRGYSKDKIWENIESEIMGVCANEAREIHDCVYEIDTTNFTTEEAAADHICNIINAKDSCQKISIDWLTYKATVDMIKEMQ